MDKPNRLKLPAKSRKRLPVDIDSESANPSTSKVFDEAAPINSNNKSYKNASRAIYKIDPTTGEKYYQCPVCSKKLKGHLAIHMRIHKNSQPWKCTTCGKRFSQKSNFQTHLQMHEKIEATKNEMSVKTEFDTDSKNFSSPTSSFSPPQTKSKVRKTKSSRRKRNQTSQGDSRISDEDINIEYELPEESKIFPCNKCGLALETAVKLSDHVKWVHSYRGGQQFSCTFCNKIFKRKEYLDIHVKKHIGEYEEVTYKCDTCDRTFFNESNFDTHRLENKCKKKEVKIVVYKCSNGMCGKVFETKQGFRRHFLNKHLKSEAKFKCEVCDTSFHLECFLKQHMVKHSGERPYVCAVCQDSFKHQPTLSKHLKKQHGIEDKDDLEFFLKRRARLASQKS